MKTFFECSACDYETPDRYFMQRHNNSEHQGNTSQIRSVCNACNFISEKVEEFESHLYESHISNITRNKKERKIRKVRETFKFKKKFNEDGKYKCYKCEMTTNDLGNIWIHVMLKHMRTNFDCLMESCSFKTQNINLIKKHIKYDHQTVTDLASCLCNECDFKSTSLADFKKHSKENHLVHIIKREGKKERRREGGSVPLEKGGSTIQCSECHYTAQLKSNLRIHVQSIHMKSQFSCKECGYSSKGLQ